MKVNFAVEVAKGDKKRVLVESVGVYENLWHFFDVLYSGRDLEIVSVTYMESKKKANIVADNLNNYFKERNKLLTEW